MKTGGTFFLDWKSDVTLLAAGGRVKLTFVILVVILSPPFPAG